MLQTFFKVLFLFGISVSCMITVKMEKVFVASGVTFLWNQISWLSVKFDFRDLTKVSRCNTLSKMYSNIM